MSERIPTCPRCEGEGRAGPVIIERIGYRLPCRQCGGKPELYAARRIAEQQEGAQE